MTRQIVWSSGGGTQSAAIAALICAGRLPKPDLSIIADTGREKSTTWQYHEQVIAPALRVVGVEIERISHTYSTVDLYSGNGDLLIPAFTSSAGPGKLDTYCSNEWKRRVCQRYVRERMPGTAVDVWLGFSTDEINRCRGSSEQWWTHVFPLIEVVRMSRADCEAAIRDAGWPAPPRSSCWMCPLMSDHEWKSLPEKDFSRAVRLESHIRSTDEHVHLHRSRQPLESRPFDQQRGLFGDDDGCRSGYCFT